MEKRIAFFHFQSVKAVAKAIDPHMKTIDSLKKKALALKEEYDKKAAKLKEDFDEKAGKVKQEYDAEMTQINALESGILQVTGFHVADLVKKVIEPTGKTDPKTSKPIKVTKYIPTEIVSYDETAKEYVVTTADAAGSDFDKDAESLETHEEVSEREAAEAEAEEEEVPETSGESADEEKPEDELPW